MRLGIDSPLTMGVKVSPFVIQKPLSVGIVEMSG